MADWLYSFDVWDTLITRRTASAHGIFAIMQDKICNDVSFRQTDIFFRQNFASIRVDTALFLKKANKSRYGHSEITLEEIYRLIANNFRLSGTLSEKLVNLELETEYRNAVPIYENIEKVRKLLKEKAQVILVSDMYLTAEQIRKILLQFDDIFNDIPIFVSGELKRSKERGDMYRHIKDIYRADYRKWRHCGDNLKTDVDNARLLRINADFFAPKVLKSYEKTLLRSGNTLEFQAYLGCSRLLNDSASEDSIYGFGVSFSGAILYSYVSWLLNISSGEGITDLYFIARDGFVLKEIADVIIAAKKLSLRTHYFYGSRLSLRIPGSENVDEFIRMTFGEYKRSFCFERLALRLGIGFDVLKKYFDVSNADKSSKQIETYEKAALASDGLKAEVIAAHEQNRKLLKRYLRQEIDFDRKFAFVDLCGSGRTQDMLESIVSELDAGRRITTFYFYNSVNTDYEKSRKITYMTISLGCMLWLEALCRCPQGQTLGYRESPGGRIEPVLENIDNSLLLKWGHEEYLCGILDFCREMSCFEHKNDISVYSSNIFKRYFGMLLHSENRQWAEFLGSVPFSEVGLEAVGASEMAKPYTLWNLFRSEDNDNLNFIRKARTPKIYYRIWELKQRLRNIFLRICRGWRKNIGR